MTQKPCLRPASLRGRQAHTVTEKILCGSVAILWFCGATAQPAEASIIGGIQKVIAGVLQPPLSTLVGTFSGPPILGTLLGAVNGTFRGVGLVAGGALELAMGGVAVAKAAAPFFLPFLL